MGVVQIQQDTSSHKLHFMPLLLLFWQFYSFREVPCVLEDSCHYCEHWKTPGDGDKLVYICLSFCCASESEGGFLLTGSGWYRPCQARTGWRLLELEPGQLKHDSAWRLAWLQGLLPIWPLTVPAQYLYFHPSLSPHPSYLAHFYFLSRRNSVVHDLFVCAK